MHYRERKPRWSGSQVSVVLEEKMIPSNEYLGGFMGVLYAMFAIGTFIGIIEDDDDESANLTAIDFFLIVLICALWPILLAAAITKKLSK